MNNFDPQSGLPLKFDPVTGQPVKPGPPPINTRTCLYHETRPMIIMEGKGDTDAEKRADVARQIRSKEQDGYTLERPHGQHPHSNDDHRIDWQKRRAAKGDKKAIEALTAKGHLAADPKAKE